MRDPSAPVPPEPMETERVFARLPVEDQLEILGRSSSREKLRYLSLVENPKELVRKLPELDFFVALKELGEKEATDLLSWSSPEQFQYVLDLEGWRRDRIDPEKILYWVNALLECGTERVEEFFETTEVESIVLLMKTFLHVLRAEGEPLEPTDRASLFTADGLYWIAFKKGEARAVLQPFLLLLYQWDSHVYHRLMEALIVELESELEETGYRLRNARLADHGFPFPEEALGIYRFVDPRSIKLAKGFPDKSMTTEAGARSSFPLTLKDDVPFFSFALSRIDDASKRDRLRGEVSCLFSKALIAEPVEQFSLDEMKRVGRKLFGYLNLGLEYLSEREEESALERLETSPLEEIFQAGFGVTLLLKKRAETLLSGSWFGGDRERLVMLDPPYREIFEGVLRKRPAFSKAGRMGHFRGLQDVAEVEGALDMIGTVVEHLEESLGLRAEEIEKRDLSGCLPEDWRSITLSTIFLTALANQVLHGIFRFEAIDANLLGELLSRLFVRDEKGKGVVRTEIGDNIRAWFSRVETDETKRRHLLAFWDFCRDLLEDELGGFPEGEAIDPRFVRGLLLSERRA